MATDVAQEWDVMQLIEPISIVRRDCARPEVEKARENAPDRGDIGIDLFAREQRAAGILARGIADLAGAAAINPRVART
jgi:hypothetical protein